MISLTLNGRPVPVLPVLFCAQSGAWRNQDDDLVFNSAKRTPSVLERIPAGTIDLVVTDPRYESLEKHRAVGTTTGSSIVNHQATMVPNLPKPAVPCAFHGNLSSSEARLALLFILRCGDHVHCKADCGVCWIQVLETADLGQEENRHGIPLTEPAVYYSFFEKGKKRLNDSGVPDDRGGSRLEGVSHREACCR